MEAHRLSLVSDEGGAAQEEEPTLPVALWIFGLQIGPGQTLAYAYLYGQTHGQGQETFDTDLVSLTAVFGRDRRTVEGWLSALEAGPTSLVRVNVDALTGRLRITVFRPVAFAPRRTTRRGRDPQRALPGMEESIAGPVAPIEEPRGQVRPTDESDRSAAPATEPPGASPQPSAQNPPGVFAQKAPGDFAQNPPSDVLALQRLIERKRSEDFRTRSSGAQNPPARALLRSEISISDFNETETRDLRSRGDFAQNPPGPFSERGSPGDWRTREADLVGQVMRSVGPLLKRTVARKVAIGVLEGWLDWADVQRAIDAAHDKVRAGECPAAFVYFVGAMKRQFADRRQPWSRRA